LAERLEEFAAIVSVIDQPEPEQHSPKILVDAANTERKLPRRLSLTARRIQTRDQGLRPFRVY
jgi:hypothetical protein